MGHLDNTSVTDRPAATPPTPIDEPRDRGWIVFLAIGVAVVVTAVVVILTSGSDDPTPTAVRTPVGTATATLDPALPAPASPTAGAAATTGAPAPGAASAPAAGSTAAAPGAALPAGWEARTFQGVTFAVPPGATQPELQDPGNADAPALFSWTGPLLGADVYSVVSVWVYPAAQAPELNADYKAITVPGADEAHMWTGASGTEPASTVVDVHLRAGDRFINLTATVAPGAAGEQTVRDLVASLSVG